MDIAQQKRLLNTYPIRVGLGVSAVFFLALIYVFQRYNVAQAIVLGFGLEVAEVHPYVIFIVNKATRLVLNDFACFLLIFAIFVEKRYLRVAFYIFLFEVLILLPIYFLIKLSLEGDSELSSPLLSQVHRMIINPTLMVLLMIGFYYQRVYRPGRKG